jgi:uncharacterized membrane protein HdeD (DUF308 family)
LRKSALRESRRGETMITSVTQIQAILAILAGILILIKPEVLNYVIAVYLILIGVLALL